MSKWLAQNRWRCKVGRAEIWNPCGLWQAWYSVLICVQLPACDQITAAARAFYSGRTCKKTESCHSSIDRPVLESPGCCIACATALLLDPLVGVSRFHGSKKQAVSTELWCKVVCYLLEASGWGFELGNLTCNQEVKYPCGSCDWWE